MIERLKVDLQIRNGEERQLEIKVNDLCNDAYGFIYSLMLFLSPLIGSNMYLSMGADSTLSIIAVINVLMVVAYLALNNGCNLFSENKVFQQQLIQLREQAADPDVSVSCESV